MVLKQMDGWIIGWVGEGRDGCVCGWLEGVMDG